MWGCFSIGVKCITLQDVGKCTLDPWLTNRLCSKALFVSQDNISVLHASTLTLSNHIGGWASVHCLCILSAFTILINLYAVCMVDGCLWVEHLCVERTKFMYIFIRVLQILHSSTHQLCIQPLIDPFAQHLWHHSSTHPFLYSSICPCTHELVGSCGLWYYEINPSGFRFKSLEWRCDSCYFVLFQLLPIRNNTSTWTFTYTRNYL